MPRLYFITFSISPDDDEPLLALVRASDQTEARSIWTSNNESLIAQGFVIRTIIYVPPHVTYLNLP